jgi:hypothetical protein
MQLLAYSYVNSSARMNTDLLLLTYASHTAMELNTSEKLGLHLNFSETFHQVKVSDLGLFKDVVIFGYLVSADKVTDIQNQEISVFGHSTKIKPTQ